MQKAPNRRYPSHRQRTVTHRRHGTSGPPDGDPSDNGHLVMTDIPQDVDHQDVDHQGVDHQEEDLLVPLVHLEILDLQDLKDHQEYLDLKEKEDIQDLQDHQDHWEEQCSHPIYIEINPLLKWC